MDNKLNEIRKQISNLRVQMAEVENQIRLQIAHDMECSEASFRLMAMRLELVASVSAMRWVALSRAPRLRNGWRAIADR